MANFSVLNAEQMADVLDDYGLVPIEFQPIEGGLANTSHRVMTDRGVVVVTVCDYHDKDSALRLVYLIDSLQGREFAPPPALATLAGPLLHVFDGKPVIVKPYIHGRCVDRVGQWALPRIGMALAQIHLTPVPDVGLDQCDRRLKPGWENHMEGCDDELTAAVTAVAGLLSGPGWDDVPTGLTHGDLFCNNIVWRSSGQPTVIDWESSSIDFFVFDLAIALVANCLHDDGSVDPDRFFSLLDSYQGVRPLGDSEMAALDPCARYASAYIARSRARRQAIYPTLVVPNFDRFTHVAANGLGVV